jgi:hypothetical protein
LELSGAGDESREHGFHIALRQRDRLWSVTRHRWDSLAVASALLFGAVYNLGCGPSVQSIHEGSVRFEHCYRLDLELEVASSHRQACWTNWLERYTYGQTRDRLEYARRRVRAGETARPELRVGGDAKEVESRQFYLVVPAPTSVHAPPPPIATRVNVTAEPPPASSAALAKSTVKAAPGADCAEGCRSAFSSCNQACASDAKSAACKSCDPDYKKCMQRCFE